MYNEYNKYISINIAYHNYGENPVYNMYIG